MTALRVGLVVVLAAGAVFAALLAGDVRSVRSAIATGDKAYVDTPSRATWQPSTRLGDTAQSLVGAEDDLRVRAGLQQYVNASKLHLRLDNALDVDGARAGAQNTLEPIARSSDPHVASQALTLLGVLGFRIAASGGSGPSQADVARSDFTDAIRLDPQNEDAAYDLELLVRLGAVHGTRVEQGQGGGFGRSGHRGAGGGQPGSGY